MDDEALKARKKAVRAAALSARASLADNPAEYTRRSRLLCERLLTLPELSAARTVFSYIPSGGECDIMPLHAALRARGVRIAFPVCGRGGAMEAYIPDDENDLPPDRFGIPSPVPERSRTVLPDRIDAVLVPCVAFDADGGRLGHGGGFYDRYLPRCPRAVRILTAFACQRAQNLPRGAYDLDMDLAVTEDAVLRFERKYDE